VANTTEKMEILFEGLKFLVHTRVARIMDVPQSIGIWQFL
jgi:hypothetical protein